MELKNKNIEILNYFSNINTILRSVPKFIESINVTNNYIIIKLNCISCLPLILKFFKNHLGYKLLMDIFAVDYPFKNNRFEVNYNILNVAERNTNNIVRFLIKIELSELNNVPSVSSIFSSAGWLEREIWDMFGIYFSSHTDLRRILTDYGFTGFPLRKDFPVTGYTEISYDDETKRIEMYPLKVNQEYRLFDFSSPWDYTH